jgi:hypothetical protein
MTTFASNDPRRFWADDDNSDTTSISELSETPNDTPEDIVVTTPKTVEVKTITEERSTRFVPRTAISTPNEYVQEHRLLNSNTVFSDTSAHYHTEMQSTKKKCER